MALEFAHVSLTPGPALAGTCDLCATTTPDLVAALLVQHERGGTVQLAACDRCVVALRRLAALTGGQARFTIAPEAGTAYRPDLPPERSTAHRPEATPGVATPNQSVPPPEVRAVQRPDPLPGDLRAATPDAWAPVLIQERTEHLRDPEGRTYVVRLYGERRTDGTWIGWAQFVALDGTAILRTGPETTQSSRDQVAYWASGLEPLYFEGAFRRAQPAAAPA